MLVTYGHVAESVYVVHACNRTPPQFTVSYISNCQTSLGYQCFKLIMVMWDWGREGNSLVI